MNGLEFVASLVHSLAWPAAIFVILYVLRNNIGQLFDGLAGRIRTGNISVEGRWGKATIKRSLDDIAEDLEGLPAELSPASGDESEATYDIKDSLDFLAAKDPDAAVLKCWTQIEQSLRGFANRRNIVVGDKDGRRLIETIERREGIDRSVFDAVRRLLAIRNIVAHYGGDGESSGSLVDPMGRREALDYIASAKKLIAYFQGDGKLEQQ